jgi:hypothetical protein
MIPHAKWTARCLLLAVAIAAGGCGGGSGLHEVTGDVTFNGEPVEAGDVLFVDPDRVLPPVHGKIVNGQFRLQCPAGPRSVEIRAAKASQNKAAPAVLFEDYIPEQFNVRSALTAEVTRGGKNHFTFDLDSRR